MASARVNFSVGLFMTAGLALATLAVIWLGMTSFLRKGEIFVTYFDESVQGLGVDSPVKYRGVPVGRVKAIRIAPDYHLIEVVILIDDKHADDENRFEDSEAAISNVGITGAMFVEIDKRAPGAPDLSPELDFTPQYPVIASRPSNIKKLFREIDEIAMKIQAIDFKGISDQAMLAFATVNTVMTEARFGDISADIRTLLASINAAANPQRLESMAKNMEQTVAASRRLMDQAARELTRLDDILVQVQAMLAFATVNTVMTEARFGDISADIRTLLASINAAANPQRLESMAKNMEQTVAASRRLMDQAARELTRLDDILVQVQAMVEANRPHVDTTMGAMASTALKADAVMTQSHATVFQMQNAIKDLEERLAVTAENLEQTSSNLNTLIEGVKDQPAQLFFGQPKAPRKVEE